MERLSLLSQLTVCSGLLLASLALRSSEWTLPQSRRAGFNAFPRVWAKRRWPALRLAVALLDALFLLLWWFGLATRWGMGQGAFRTEGAMLWKLAFLGLALSPWMLLVGMADAPRRRLRLAFHRQAFLDLRRFERTAGLLWLFRVAIGLRLALWMAAP